MPGGEKLITFLSKSWDYPEPIIPPVLTARWEAKSEEKVEERPEASKSSLQASGSDKTLKERWQLTHGRDPPAWADKGFAGIWEHMQQQAVAAEGTREEVTLFCPPLNLEPRQQLRALLDDSLPGVQVPVVHPTGHEDGQPIPDHTLPRFQGNPADNFNVLSPVPDYLRSYWTKMHQSPRWRGDGDGDIRTQENRLQKVITGYAAQVTHFMTTYEYRAPHGLNHGLSSLYDEGAEYLVPTMVEGDFVTLYQEREVHRKQLAHLEQQALKTQSETDIETNILRAQMAGLHQGVKRAHQEKEQLEEQVRMVSAREEKTQDALQATKERLAKQARDLAVLRKSLEAGSHPAAPVPAKSEVVSSKALTVTIAQMTIGAAPPLVASATTRQSAAAPVSTTIALPRQSIITSIRATDTATTIAHFAAQMATGS